MNKCIAIPMENGVLCAHFGHCEYFSIITVENNQVVDIKELTPPEHLPGAYPKWVASHQVTDVIAGGMGQKAVNLFMEQNINVFTGAPMKDAQSIVVDFLNNRLSLEGNYCNHDEHHQHACRH